jgi:putative DNA methylase
MTQMTHYPKRLIEVDLPIKRISAHARREKSIRHGHISTLHIWWARRPLAASVRLYGPIQQILSVPMSSA